MENHDDSAGMKTEWALYGDNLAIFGVASHIDLSCRCSDSPPPARELETMLMHVSMFGESR